MKETEAEWSSQLFASDEQVQKVKQKMSAKRVRRIRELVVWRVAGLDAAERTEVGVYLDELEDRLVRAERRKRAS